MIKKERKEWKVISVIIWTTGTISISFGKYLKTQREVTKSSNYRK
jgi:hypothetical protein